jgi:hypothetical protein
MKYLKTSLTPFLASPPEHETVAHPNDSPIPAVHNELNPVYLYSSRLFCALCHSQKSELLCNQLTPASFCKTPGVGYPAPATRGAYRVAIQFLSSHSASLDVSCACALLRMMNAPQTFSLEYVAHSCTSIGGWYPPPSPNPSQSFFLSPTMLSFVTIP